MKRTETEPTIFIRGHAGLGDHLVCNAIYRHFAETHNVVIPVKFHNVPSVQFMVRGLPIALLGVKDDSYAETLASISEKRGGSVLRLGMFGKGFDEKRWDSCFFEQAGIPFEHRWSKWKVERLPWIGGEICPPVNDYILVHEDKTRGFLIDRKRLPHNLEQIEIAPITRNVFDWCSMIENATELHLIDSCFAILADSLNTLKAKRKVVHLYARPNALPPTYMQNWEILK